MSRSACLTVAELAAFSVGQCDDSAADEIAAHLEACPQCETLARELDTQGDVLVDRLRAAGAAGPVAPSERPQQIGQYDVLEEIGRGGMGVVYRARHRQLDRTVAIKLLLAGPYASPAVRDRFLIEARAAAQVQHPHIVQVFEIGQLPAELGPPCPYLVLEYVSGESLAQRIARGPLPARVAAQWLATLARAVAAAHRQGIIHRDIKPSNVLLADERTPKLCDFGVAKILSAAETRTMSGDLIGTAEYMAPEQASGRGPVGPATDVYALGALLYAMLTGRPPLQGASLVETLQQVQSQEPVAPRRWQPAVPRDLEVIALACLEKEPRRRYATAEALADDLERQLRGESIAARPAGPLARSLRWCRRRPREALALAAIAVLAVASATLGAWQVRQQALRSQEATRTAEAALQEAVGLAGEARASSDSVLLWRQALAAARRAQQAVDSGPVADDARQRVQQSLASIEKATQEAEQLAHRTARDLAMRKKLDEVRIGQTAFGHSGFVLAAADEEYAAAFRDYSIDVHKLTDDRAAALVRGSEIRVELLAALDNWAVSLGHTDFRRRLVQIANLADDDPWRRRLRDALLARNGGPLLALAADPSLAQQPAGSHERLSMALVSIGAWQPALDVMRRAREQFPDDFWINHQLAMTYYQARPPQYLPAIRYFTAATAIRPQSAGAWFNLGIVLQYNGDLDESQRAFERTLSMTPDYAPAHYGIGCILAARKQPDEALARFATALRLQPQYAEAEFSSGHVLLNARQAEKGIAALQRAIALRPGFAVAHIMLGNAWMDRGDDHQAQIAFRRAIAADPGMAEAHCNLGHVLSRAGRFPEALVCFKRGHELGTQQPGWRYPSAQWCQQCREQIAR